MKVLQECLRFTFYPAWLAKMNLLKMQVQQPRIDSSRVADDDTRERKTHKGALRPTALFCSLHQSIAWIEDHGFALFFWKTDKLLAADGVAMSITIEKTTSFIGMPGRVRE